MRAAAVSPSEAVDEGWTQEEAGRAGVWLFIVSEILLFGAFFASYLSTRLGNAECALGVTAWPEAGHLPGLALASVNTLILLTSSFTMARAVARARRGDARGTRANLTATIALGACFLVVKSAEYALKIRLGYYPGSDLAKASGGLSIFLSYYYGMTILHGLHVAAGMAWNAFALAGVGSAPRLAERRVELAGLYWHFVDVVWVFLFPLLYLI